jgi:hypothetical protein
VEGIPGVLTGLVVQEARGDGREFRAIFGR